MLKIYNTLTRKKEDFKPLEEGKVNDLIQIKNVKTKKVIQAVVTGPNTVKVIF